MSGYHGISLYNQDRFDNDTFVANFVARNETVDVLLNTLREIAGGAGAEHQIIIGARGMGKTSLLRRLAIAIDLDPMLRSHFIPLRFREEQYNIISLSAFWRNCGESLAEWSEQSGRQALADRLDLAIESPEWRDSERAAVEFLSACKEAGGRAVLLLDNLDLILDGLADEHWLLRSALQRTDGPIVVGAATQLLSQGGDRDAAFYEFFHPHFLEPLDERELLACLNALADLRGVAGEKVKAVLAQEPERVRALYVLTGGNPRILALIYQILERVESDAIFADLEALLDQVTPFYKARIEEYQTPQQRAVIDAVALNWDPITSGALALATGIEVTTISSQLSRLKKDGLIEEVPTSGSRAGYQLSERFLNIWYLMRHGTRKTKQRLRWFTIFLTKLFSTDELGRMASEARGKLGHGWQPDHCEAVIEAFEIRSKSQAGTWEAGQAGEVVASRLSASAAVPGAIIQQLDAVIADIENDRFASACESLDTVITFLSRPEHLQQANMLAVALLVKGFTLRQLDRADEGIETYNEIITRFGDSDDPEVQEHVATALFNKGYIHGQLDRADEEIAVYDEIIARFGYSDRPKLKEQVGMALFNKGVTLGQLDRADEEIEIYDEIITRFGDSDEPLIQEQVAMALVNKGVTLGQLDRPNEEIAIFDEVVERFGDSGHAEVREQIAKALFNKGVALGQLDRSEEEIAVYDEIVARFGDSEEIEVKKRVVKALFNKAVTLHQLGRTEAVLSVCDEVVANFGDDNDPEVQERVAKALLFKGITLEQAGRWTNAPVAFESVIARYGDNTHPEICKLVDVARVRLGMLLLSEFGNASAAEAVVRSAVNFDPHNDALVVTLFWAIVAQGRVDEAQEMFQRLEHIRGIRSDLMRAGLEIAKDNIGLSLEHLASALDAGLTEGEFSYFEELLWYLRSAAARGHGERIVAWLGESGHAERYAPVYGAFAAHVHGEQFLLDLNPEVRKVAAPLYAKLSGGKRATAHSDPIDRPKRGRSSRRRNG